MSGKNPWDGWQIKYPTMEAQAEYFLLKFGKDDDIKRGEVLVLKDQFQKYAKPGKGELEEDEAMRLLEARNQTKTFKELRQMVADIDLDKNRKLSFLEWACAIYSKSWEQLHTSTVDPAIVAAAEREAVFKKEQEEKARTEEDEKRVQELQAKADKANKDQDAEAAGRAKKELESELKRQEEELKRRHAEEAAERARKEANAEQKKAEELKQQGIRGKVAIFKYAAQDVKDPTKGNEKLIKEEATKRRALKQQEIEALAKKKLAEEEISRKKAEAETARLAAERAEKESVAASKKKVEAEEEARKAEEDKKRAVEKSEAPIREAYEKKKKEEEEKQQLKKEGEEKKRQDGRQKISSKAKLWNQSSVTEVVKSIGGDQKKNLKKTETIEKTGLDQDKLFFQIRKGTALSSTPGAKTSSEELSDEQKAEFLADQIKKRGSTSTNQ